TVRVVRRGKGGDPDGQAGSEQAVEHAHGGGLTSGVRVKAQHDFVHVTLEDARVVGGEGGALRSEDVARAAHVAGDEVELAFADDGEAGVEDGAFGFVEAE